MNKFAVIGASEFQNPLILKAKEMGYETHVFAWAADDIGEHTADVFHPVSITEKDEILRICREVGISGIATAGSDLAVHAVNHVARAMGLPANPPITDVIATNKYRMREALLAAGLVTPRFALSDGDMPPQQAYDFTFPLIVKPTDRSGSRGIFKIEHPDELAAAVKQSAALSFEKRAIVEEFFEGDEFSCECISFEGVHRRLAITRKATTGAPHFIETGHVQPASLSEAQQAAVEETVFAALDALQIRYGASHAEFRIGADGVVRIVEVGSRMGGDCIGTDLVPMSTGHDFVRMIVDVACGRAPVLCEQPLNRRAEIRFILTEQDWQDYLTVKQNTPQRIYRTSEHIGPPDGSVSDSSTRFGFYLLWE